MKTKSVFCAMILVIFGSADRSFGQQYFSNVGGTQVWNSATANWAAISGGPYDTAWASGDAIFEGTAGTVTADTISANSLTFTVAGYKLTGGTITLTGPTNTVMVGTVTNASTLSGTAGLVKTGSGTLVLAAVTNLYSGGTLVSGGTLQVNSDGQLSAAGESLTLAGGTFRNTSPLNTTYRPLTLGAGGGTINLGYYLNYNGPITGGSGLFVSGSDFILAPPSANNIGTITMSGSRLFINNPNAMANNMAITITNTARLAFQSTAPTSFTNPVTFASGCGFCARVSNITLNTTNCAFPSSGSFSFNVDDAYTYPMQVVGSWPTLTGGLTLQVGGGNTNVGAVGATTISAPLTGPYSVTKTGTSTSPGTLVLAASNTFSGLIISSGTVKMGHVNALGTTNVTVNPGGILDLAGYNPQIRGIYDSASLGAVTSGVITNSGALATLSIIRANYGFGGTIAGPINVLIPSGGGSYQVLSGNNTYTGTTTIAGGSLELWNTNVLGTVSAGTSLTNGSLAMKGLQGIMNFAAEPLSINGSCYFYLNTDSILTNANWTGPMTLTSNAVFNITRAGGAGKPSLINLQGTITGAGGITKSDTNMVVMLSGANDFSGGTTLTSGLLLLGHPNGLGTGPVVLNTGVLDLNGNSATIGALNGTTSGAIVDLSAGSGTNTLTINQASSSTATCAISNGLNKTIALTKTGAGILTLNATNTFQGAVTINGGTLRIGVAAALTGNVSTITVNTGGTLDLYSQSLNNGSRNVVIAGPGAAGQSGALVNTANGAEAQVYTLTLSDDAAVGSTGNKLNVYGLLNGNGHVLTIGGTTEVNIRPNNAFVNLAGITINSGLLRLESNQGWTGTYTVNAGGKLDSYGANRIEAGNVFLNGGKLLNGGTGQMPAYWTGAFSVAATGGVDTAGGNITLSNAVTGTGALIVTGTNTLTLCGTNTFSGWLCVSNGTTTLKNASLAHANITVISNAVLNGNGTLHARIATGSADHAVIKGTLNLNTFALDLDVTGSLQGGAPFTLFEATEGGTLTGHFQQILDVPAGYTIAYRENSVQLVCAGTIFSIR